MFPNDLLAQASDIIDVINTNMVYVFLLLLNPFK